MINKSILLNKVVLFSISTTVLCVCTFHVSLIQNVHFCVTAPLIQNLHFCVTAPLIYILSDGLDREGAARHLFTPIFPSLFPWNPYLTPFPPPPPLLPSIKPPPLTLPHPQKNLAGEEGELRSNDKGLISS